jgi:hypothetical protein
MDIERTRNLRMFDRAREKLKDIIDMMDGNAFTHEEIEVSLEELEKGVKQIREFWEKKLKKN